MGCGASSQASSPNPASSGTRTGVAEKKQDPSVTVENGSNRSLALPAPTSSPPPGQPTALAAPTAPAQHPLPQRASASSLNQHSASSSAACQQPPDPPEALLAPSRSKKSITCAPDPTLAKVVVVGNGEGDKQLRQLSKEQEQISTEPVVNPLEAIFKAAAERPAKPALRPSTANVDIDGAPTTTKSQRHIKISETGEALLLHEPDNALYEDLNGLRPSSATPEQSTLFNGEHDHDPEHAPRRQESFRSIMSSRSVDKSKNLRGRNRRASVDMAVERIEAELEAERSRAAAASEGDDGNGGEDTEPATPELPASGSPREEPSAAASDTADSAGGPC